MEWKHTKNISYCTSFKGFVRQYVITWTETLITEIIL